MQHRTGDPQHCLGSTSEINIWHRTLVRGKGPDSSWIQADRGARAQRAVFFNPGEAKAAYLAGEPADDDHMPPDVLRYDHREPARYPDNWRTLTDDVPDYVLPLFTNGKVTGDGVSAHTDLLAEFPYLGPPHGSYEDWTPRLHLRGLAEAECGR